MLTTQYITLVRVIYSEVSGQCSHTIPILLGRSCSDISICNYLFVHYPYVCLLRKIVQFVLYHVLSIKSGLGLKF